MTRWLITGGCGFIGCNLVRHLLAEGGHAVRVLDNLEAGGPERLAAVGPVHKVSAAAPAGNGSGGAIELVVGDILDPELVCRSARGREILVHLAANTGVGPSVEDPRRDCLTNVVGTLNCLEAARHAGVRRFVFASSCAPLGAVEPPVHEDKPPRPVSPYGASKLAGEGYCSAYWRSFGLETVALRFGNVYGPGSDRKSSVVAAFARRALAGQPLEVYGDGSQTRDFIFVDDLVRAILKAAHVPGIGGEIFQIATARETTVDEIARLLVELLAQAGLPRVPVRYAAPRTGDVLRSYADTTKAERLLGWRATTPLEEGVLRVMRWFQERSADAETPVRYEVVAQAAPLASLAP
ncbi:MAG TPA: NAD-dependent epimerase/dehydratase family protein [Geminicoccaceae bacterium]